MDPATDVSGVGPRDEEITDVLPEDLDASGFVGPYLFPNNSRRRIPAIIYLSLAVVCAVVWAITRSGDSPLVNGGVLAAGIGLAVFSLYGFVAGRELKVDESEALLAAVRAVGFPVGHASAQMGWRGWLSRPTWRILLYSNEPQPQQRGLVFVDGLDGEVLDLLVQENPEDWSSFQNQENPEDWSSFQHTDTDPQETSSGSSE